jgi:hypothetical protein
MVSDFKMDLFATTQGTIVVFGTPIPQQPCNKHCKSCASNLPFTLDQKHNIPSQEYYLLKADYSFSLFGAAILNDNSTMLEWQTKHVFCKLRVYETLVL